MTELCRCSPHHARKGMGGLRSKRSRPCEARFTVAWSRC